MFTAYSETFYSEGEIGAEYDFSTLTIPVVNNYVKNDDTCDDAVNRPIFDKISSTVRSTTWMDARTHGGLTSIIGWNDAESVETLLAQLRTSNTADRTLASGNGDWCDLGELDWGF